MVALSQPVSRGVNLLDPGVTGDFARVEMHDGFAYLAGHESRRDHQNRHAPTLLNDLQLWLTSAKLTAHLRQQETIHAGAHLRDRKREFANGRPFLLSLLHIVQKILAAGTHGHVVSPDL